MAQQEKPLTQNQIVERLSLETGLSKADVKCLLMAQTALTVQQLKKRGIGVFKVPFLGVKLSLKKKPATKAREGRNPATGETIMIAAKPARKDVKATVLKGLKTDVLG